MYEKYLKIELQDLQIKAQNFQFQLDQVSVAKDQFTNALIASLEEDAA